MTYVDTSVILRLAFGEPNALPGWRTLPAPVTSRLARVEALRTLDRRHAQGGMTDADFALRRAFVLGALDSLDQVSVDEAILARAEAPFPTPLRTLDAIHLATAAALARDGAITVATHDLELGTAARAMGFQVIGT